MRSREVGFALAFGVVVFSLILAVTTPAGASSAAGSRLEGMWRTATISQADAEATLRRVGLAKWIPQFRPNTPFATPTTLVLTIKGGKWDLYGKPQGKPREPIDFNAKYVIRGNTVEKIHKSGSTTLRWSVNQNVLTLRWLKTNEPAFAGIPDVVFQKALYHTKKFTRAAA